MLFFRSSLLAFFLFICMSTFAQYSIYEPLDLDEVQFSLSDFGTMWIFDDIPREYWKDKYGFEPTDEWLKNVRLSALQFGGGCSGAFVSEDGLIMTNHHCGRGNFPKIQTDEENILRDGFYAESLEQERKVPGVYVDQLLSISDVTEQIHNVMIKGDTDAEKIILRDSLINVLDSECESEDGIQCRVVTLYNGAKYSLYKYKRYSDIRLVMAPDFQIAATGWDWDNFTYPRYELDFAFYRAYENDKPVKVEHHFTWSEKGADDGELIFTIGRPGSTDRLVSVVELEYYRDKYYPLLLKYFNERYKIYRELLDKNPEDESELLHKILSSGNSRKSYAGSWLGLKDEYLMTKKRDFENKLREKTKNSEVLNKKYGHLWDSITEVVKELSETADLYYAYQFFYSTYPDYYKIAERVINYAEEMKKPETDRDSMYIGENLVMTKENIFPSEFDEPLHKLFVRVHANYLADVLGGKNDIVEKVYGGYTGDNAVHYALSHSSISTKEKLMNFIENDPEEILNSDDPFIYFLRHTRDKYKELSDRRKEANNTLSVLNQELGKLISELYKGKIPPDATSSLRISDGVIKGYEYNGTIAPGKTTFYGLWDRYNSFDKSTYPWGLHERWKTPPPELDLSIPVCFASTNDIVGGNSGSSIINTKMEVVGLVHDGNLESLAGDFAFLPENNRAVATDSYGLMEALKHIYKTDKLVRELTTGGLQK